MEDGGWKPQQRSVVSLIATPADLVYNTQHSALSTQHSALSTQHSAQETTMARGFDDDEILGKAYDGRLVRRLAVFVQPYWRKLLVAIVLLLGAALAELAPPLLVQQAIDG